MPPVIVYVHGVGNKPPAEQLRRQWDQALFGATLDSRSRLAYWADLRYPAPLGEAGAVDEVAEEVAAAVDRDGAGPHRTAAPAPEAFAAAALAEAVAASDGATDGAESAAAEGHDELVEWARRMTYAADALAAGEAPAVAPTEEVLPLPRPLRQAAFRA